MKDTILELWNEYVISGNLDFENDEQKLMGYIERHRNNLISELDEKGKDSFQKFEDCFDELLDIECRNAFKQGFSLATKLVAEALLK